MTIFLTWSSDMLHLAISAVTSSFLASAAASPVRFLSGFFLVFFPFLPLVLAPPLVAFFLSMAGVDTWTGGGAGSLCHSNHNLDLLSRLFRGDRADLQLAATGLAIQLGPPTATPPNINIT